MTTATAQANPNLAFIKFTLAKLGRSNGQLHFGSEFIPSRDTFSGAQNKSLKDYL